MSPRIAVATLALLTIPVAARAASGDDWFGSDKPRHFAACVAATGVGYGAGAVLFDSTGARALTGVGLGLGVGLGKELYDRARGSVFSVKDLAWDTAGTATGLLASFLVDRFITEVLLPPPRGVVAGRGGGRVRTRAALHELQEQVALEPGLHQQHAALGIIGVGDEHGDLPAWALVHAARGRDAHLPGESPLGELSLEPARQVLPSAPGALRQAFAADEHVHLPPLAARVVVLHPPSSVAPRFQADAPVRVPGTPPGP
ncbi:hypothetical protein [Corallococcus carmarthensis]|uniref:hypothetical protein n=1 Tax=Corallococcus carmarthensis TaxID=2316728 RepID=UPI00148CE9A1|nr:hypothetical protein [Corallococcus carmarthensis]NOK22799.1 hypothetical protein [Corallococcus carmarthensis]